MATDTERFLRAFTSGLPSGMYFYLWTLSSDKKRKYTRWYESADEAASDAASQQFSYDVYVGMSLSREKRASYVRIKNEDSGGIFGVWLDVDFGTNGHKQDGLPGNEDDALGMLEPLFAAFAPTIVVNSGGGLHCYWLFREPWLFEDDEARERGAALVRAWLEYAASLARERGFAFDISGKDLARVLRVPATLNHKYDPPREATLVHIDEEARYTPADLAKAEHAFLAANPPPPKRAPAQIVRLPVDEGIVVDSSRQLPFNKWQALFENNAKFKKTWNHKRPDLDAQEDSSASVYEMALMAFMVAASWTDQEIVDAVTCWRAQHHLEPFEKTAHYFEFSIGKARGLAQLESANPPKAIRPENVEQGEMFSGDDGQGETEPPTREQMLAQLSRLLNINIQRIVQYDGAEPVFHMLTDRGIVILGGANKLINQTMLREKLAQKQRIFRGYSKAQWHTIAQMMLDCVDVEEIPEATLHGRIAAILERYLEKVQIMPSPEDAAETGQPFEKDGHVYIKVDHLRRWLAEHDPEKFSMTDVLVMLKTYGAEQTVVACYAPNGKRTSRGVWKLPNVEQEAESEAEHDVA